MKCLFFGAGLFVVVFQIIGKVSNPVPYVKLARIAENEPFFHVAPCIFGHFW